MPSTKELPRLVVTRAEAARQLDSSVQHIDDLVNAGKLKKIALGTRRVAITYPSLVKFVEEAA